MNKKLLLLALPAFMVLSSCGSHPVEQPEERPEAAMSESTVAQEEDAREFVRTNTTYRVALTSDYVKVGYQIQFNANGEGDADDTISIRFVAALKGEVTSAYWHRGLAQPNSYEGADVGGGSWKYKFSDNTTHQSTVFYTALNNGGVRVAAGEGDFVGYDRFAIYTLMNIPYETYKDSYLAAYVDLSSDNTISSRVLAVKIERNGTASKNSFFFDAAPSHFLQGTINDVVRDGRTNDVLVATEYNDGNYFATYNNLSVKASDNFGSFYFGNGHFQFFGNTSFFDGSRLYFDASSSLGEYSSPKADGTYNVKVYSGSTPTENHVFTSSTVDGANQNYVLKNMQNWIGNAEAVIIANIHCHDDSWMYAEVPFTKGSGDDDAYNGSASFIAPNNIVEFELLRCVPGTTTSTVVWDNNHIWNITTGKINVSNTNVYAFNASEWRGY